ncbi:MAG: hypothetical protein L0Y71_15315 [Gemmataceae bacterium]|nr:hypothetical protein [Gemmataceae bacterium]
MIRFFAVLFLLGSLGSGVARAEFDVTIDNLKKTSIGMMKWKVEYSGTFKKMTDRGGGYEKWDMVTFKIEQTGKSAVVSQVYVIPPTLTADGSWSAVSTVDQTADPNWKAWAIATIHTNATDTVVVQPNKEFTLP